MQGVLFYYMAGGDLVTATIIAIDQDFFGSYVGFIRFIDINVLCFRVYWQRFCCRIYVTNTEMCTMCLISIGLHLCPLQDLCFIFFFGVISTINMSINVIVSAQYANEHNPFSVTSRARCCAEYINTLIFSFFYTRLWFTTLSRLQAQGARVQARLSSMQFSGRKKSWAQVYREGTQFWTPSLKKAC